MKRKWPFILCFSLTTIYACKEESAKSKEATTEQNPKKVIDGVVCSWENGKVIFPVQPDTLEIEGLKTFRVLHDSLSYVFSAGKIDLEKPLAQKTIDADSMLQVLSVQFAANMGLTDVEPEFTVVDGEMACDLKGALNSGAIMFYRTVFDVEEGRLYQMAIAGVDSALIVKKHVAFFDSFRKVKSQ